MLKNLRGHTDLNHGPIGLQPIALPLSYIPLLEVSWSNVCSILNIASQLYRQVNKEYTCDMSCEQLTTSVHKLKKLFSHAVTRIRTGVSAATTQGPNH